MTDTRRIQLDLKNLPEGLVPKLRALAFELDYDRFSDFARDVFIHAAEYDGDIIV